MQNTPQNLPHPSDIESLFRYQVISIILAQEQMGQLRPQAVKSVADMVHATLDNVMKKVSPRTLYRWLAAFEAHGFAGLQSAQRSHTPDSVVIPENVSNFIKQEKIADPQASVPELIRRAKESGLTGPEQSIHRATVWRSLKRMAVDTSRSKARKDRDCRRFSFPHRMDMVMCDGKHFRAGVARLRRVALFFIDDASRVVLDVKVGTTENTQLFLNGLYLTLVHHGLMTTLFVDNGSGFIAHDAIDVLRNLNILFIHGTAGYPQGRGKIERFNRTASDQMLRLLDGNPDIDPDCASLELRLRHYLHGQYNHTPHESLDGMTPWSRFVGDPKPMRPYRHAEALHPAFILKKQRSVSNDHVISFNGIHYEAPRGLAGTKIILHHNALDDSVEIFHQNRMVRLTPLDAHTNARDKRAKNVSPCDQIAPQNITKTSTQMAFDRDHRPIVGADGGFPIPQNSSKINQENFEP
ncbi:MAG TPA: DDE-type integrase/transposase/recombinase [Magnetococcales bacterium]|nr:DDE-type integrase/transposase/recombinase [Magnetococcales bacterium]